ncbi:MAG: 5-nitroimidazole antibiotic resistance protein [Firmicutes bacterium]|nr:5-nitroimidazole antibiotic resistance protein [Bacillota bacterium]
MRRKELEITDLEKIEELLKRYNVMRVGFYDGEKIHIFPVNFGYEMNGDVLTLFFHGAKSGTKAELSKNEPVVSFEMDECIGIEGKGTKACKYTCHYSSVMGSGRIGLVENADEKRHALDVLMKGISEKENFDYDDKILAQTAVYKIVADEFRAKMK